MSSPELFYLPEGTKIVCRSSTWKDVAKFFLLNYVLHALTIPLPPGSGTATTILVTITATIAPFSGCLYGILKIQRGLNWILKVDRPNHNEDHENGDEIKYLELSRALHAGALCMVSTSFESWRRRLVRISPYFVQVHGQHAVPIKRLSADRFLGGWMIPSNAPSSKPCLVAVSDDLFQVKALRYPDDHEGVDMLGTINICSNYSITKQVAALAQTLYASFELYQGGKHQIPKYGYTAYQITVIPYLLMSLVNLFASMGEPEYPTRYLVENKCADSEIPGVKVTGAVAQAIQKDSCNRRRKYRLLRPGPGLRGRIVAGIVWLLLIIVLVAPWVMISLLTSWKSMWQGKEDEQTLILFWLVFTQCLSPFIVFSAHELATDFRLFHCILLIPLGALVVFYTLKLWVQVGNMMSKSDICMLVG